MKATLHMPHGDVVVDLASGRDISTTLEFHGEQANAFGLPRAEAEPFRAGPFVGDTREGGSVNCETVTLNPHGNGTHTECVGHIVNERVRISDVLEDTLSLCEIVSITPESLSESGESYEAPHSPEDLVVTKAALSAAWSHAAGVNAMVIRTLPNPDEKRHRTFSGNNPVYFTTDAMTFIRQLNIKHLLVDFPSVDREEDGGVLPNHHIFWEVPIGTHQLVNVGLPHTITEMIYVPDDVVDGLYALTIQIPDFALDAAPSRPRIFNLEKR